MIEIVDIKPSTRKDKRFVATLNIEGNIKQFHFGAKTGETYIDHHDEKKRDNYRKRHLASKREGHYIKDLTPSSATLAFWILWGDNTNILDNIVDLQKKFCLRTIKG
jgi:hypothetical protein